MQAVGVALDEKPLPQNVPGHEHHPRLATFRGQLVVFASEPEHRRTARVLGGLRRALKLEPVAPPHPLADLQHYRELNLSYPTVCDHDLVYLDDATQLLALDLSDSAITNAGLAHLAGLTQLRRLDLARTNITRAGVSKLSGLVNLEYLDLSGTKIDGAIAYYLRGMTKLRHLKLADTPVHDTRYLAELKHVRALCLRTPRSTIKTRHIWPGSPA
jgi:hypothetical protein